MFVFLCLSYFTYVVIFRSVRLATWACLATHTVKNLSTMQEIWVCPLGQEDPLEKGTATHSSILA